MGYVRGFVHGTVIGTVIGLCVAPQEGRRTREQVQRTVGAAREGMQAAQDTARRLAPTAQSAAHGVGGMVAVVRGRVERMRAHDTDAEQPIAVNGSGLGGSEG